jgi:hypothetical protein
MTAKGFEDYIKDIWNLCDVLKTGIMWTFVTIKLVNHDEIYQKLSSSLNFLLFFKLFLGLNQIQDIRILFRLVKSVAWDMIPFACFLVMALLMVGSSMYYLNTYDFIDENGKYMIGEEEPIYIAIRNMYLTTFGEYSVDDYTPGMWFVFISATVILSLIMLNLLIAIMSDTFEKVMNEIEESDGLEKNDLILEAESI